VPAVVAAAARAARAAGVVQRGDFGLPPERDAGANRRQSTPINGVFAVFRH
jgi:hypothetical protein